MTQIPLRFKVSERGIAVVLLAAGIMTLLALTALVVGFGFISTSKARMDAIANAAALAAIQAFSEAPSPVLQERLQIAKDRVEALLAENGTLPGFAGPFGGLTVQAGGLSTVSDERRGGLVEFGIYYLEAPGGGQNATGRCARTNAVFPCFDPTPTEANTNQINAARVSLTPGQGQQSFVNLLTVPFGVFVGRKEQVLTATGMASNTPRCFVLALDLSPSVVFETHFSPPISVGDRVARPQLAPNNSPFYHLRPNIDSASQFAFPERFGDASTTFNLSNIRCAEDPNSFAEPWYYWCNMLPKRSDDKVYGKDDINEVFPGQLPVESRRQNPRYHFQSDYRLVQTNRGRFFIDSYVNPQGSQERVEYRGPEPYTRLFQAFNAGLRAVQTVGTPADRGLMYLFAGTMQDVEPCGEERPPNLRCATANAWRLTNNFDYLIQLTNLENRPLFSFDDDARNPDTQPQNQVREENAIRRGWFPVLSNNPLESSTNPVLTLVHSIDALSACAPGSQKSIIIATDGAAACRQDLYLSETDGRLVPGDTDCSAFGFDFYQNYLDGEEKMLGPLVRELNKNRISVTTLIDSREVGPSLRNVWQNGRYLEPTELFRNGYCGVPGSSGSGANCSVFADVQAVIPYGLSGEYSLWLNYPRNQGGCGGCEDTPENKNAFALLAMGQPGVVFRRPFAAFSQLANATGGVICPIQPRCDFSDPATRPYTPHSSCTENPYASGRLRDECRNGWQGEDPPAEDAFQPCSVLDQTEAQQALSCVLGVLGPSTYTVVGEE